MFDLDPLLFNPAYSGFFDATARFGAVYRNQWASVSIPFQTVTATAEMALLRSELQRICQKHHWQAFIPPFSFCTDNAAMVGIAATLKYERGEYADISLPPYTR